MEEPEQENKVQPVGEINEEVHYDEEEDDLLEEVEGQRTESRTAV